MANTKLSVTNLEVTPNDPCERIYHEGTANVDQFAIHFNFSGFRHSITPTSLKSDTKLNNVWVHEIDDYGINKLFLGNVPMQTNEEGKKAFETMFKLKQYDLLETVIEEFEQTVKLDNGRRNVYELSLEEMGRLLYHHVQYGVRKIGKSADNPEEFIAYRVWEVKAILDIIKTKYPEEYEIYLGNLQYLTGIKILENKWTVAGYKSDILFETVESFYTDRCVR